MFIYIHLNTSIAINDVFSGISSAIPDWHRGKWRIRIEHASAPDSTSGLVFYLRRRIRIEHASAASSLVYLPSLFLTSKEKVPL